MQGTKKEIMNATIDIVAEKGLEGFSISQIAKQIGIAKGTIYCHFATKEDLLYACFLMINREIAALFEKATGTIPTDKAETLEFLHQQWLAYFAFMLRNGNKSLFYYAYRESEHLDRVLMRNNQDVAKEMESFTRVIGGAFLQSGVLTELPADYLWAHIIDGTGIYVKHILRNHIAREEADAEKFWKLLSGGIFSFM